MLALVTACKDSGAPSAATGFKVALLTPGSIRDGGWNQSAYEGLERIRDELGAEIEADGASVRHKGHATTIVSVPIGVDYDRIQGVVSDEFLDAQKAELAHLQGAEGVRVVWESRDLPAMTVVAFPSAPAAEREKFKQSLAGVCDGDGRSACQEVGIRALEAGSPEDYAAIVAAYGR